MTDEEMEAIEETLYKWTLIQELNNSNPQVSLETAMWVVNNKWKKTKLNYIKEKDGVYDIEVYKKLIQKKKKA